MTLTQLIEREMVRTDEGLAALCAELRAAGRFALDTEFLGERSYVPKLCLVQVATREFIALVDTLAVKNLAPLWALVGDPGVEKVLHAAREDLRLAFYGGGRLTPRGIFDTQIAAGFVGLPMYPLSYARLVEALAGVKLGKGETRSEWDRRPLTPEQIRYARDDVRYLLPVADKLQGVLKRLGRDGWMGEEMGRFSESRVYELDPDQAYLRLRGPRAGFTTRPTALLRAVAAWRERRAADLDVPTRSVLRDEVLTEIALRPPRRLTDFTRLRSFPEGEEADLGPGILAALDAARALPEDQWPPALAGAFDEGTPAERAAADLLHALGESLCLARNLAPELVLGRADALALARRQPDPPLLTGWRRQALGEELSRLAAGNATARVQFAAEGPQVSLS
ncbi:MAG: ribonuclease D [Armatimonadetes bacterium]|nr:ribonuclease D [Armatimonadota bacterium]